MNRWISELEKRRLHAEGFEREQERGVRNSVS
jgi:hypothetical protein